MGHKIGDTLPLRSAPAFVAIDGEGAMWRYREAQDAPVGAWECVGHLQAVAKAVPPAPTADNTASTDDGRKPEPNGGKGEAASVGLRATELTSSWAISHPHRNGDETTYWTGDRWSEAADAARYVTAKDANGAIERMAERIEALFGKGYTSPLRKNAKVVELLAPSERLHAEVSGGRFHWLLEAKQGKKPNGEPVYWAGDRWTKDVNEAALFPTKHDAESVLHASSLTLSSAASRARFVDGVQAVEHGWCVGRAAPPWVREAPSVAPDWAGWVLRTQISSYLASETVGERWTPDIDRAIRYSSRTGALFDHKRLGLDESVKPVWVDRATGHRVTAANDTAAAGPAPNVEFERDWIIEWKAPPFLGTVYWGLKHGLYAWVKSPDDAIRYADLANTVRVIKGHGWAHLDEVRAVEHSRLSDTAPAETVSVASGDEGEVKIEDVDPVAALSELFKDVPGVTGVRVYRMVGDGPLERVA